MVMHTLMVEKEKKMGSTVMFMLSAWPCKTIFMWPLLGLQNVLFDFNLSMMLLQSW